MDATDSQKFVTQLPIQKSFEDQLLKPSSAVAVSNPDVFSNCLII